MEYISKRYVMLLVMLIVMSIALHLLPFFLYTLHPLGYDTGFYRRYLIQPSSSFPNDPVPGLGNDALLPRFFLDILRMFSLPPDVILYGSYIMVIAASAGALFFWTNSSFGTRAALFATLLFVTSPVQYSAYWFMFYKQAFATLVMLLAFLALEKRHWLIFPLGLAVIISHHTTSVIFLLTLIIFFILNKDRRKEILLLFIPAFSLFLLLHFDFYTQSQNFPQAVFMNRKEYLIFSLPLLVPLFFALRRIVSQKNLLFLAFTLAAVAFPLFSLPFYQRIFIFTDIALLIAAAVGYANLEHTIRNVPRRFATIALAILVAFSMGWFWSNLSGRIKTLTPVIDHTTLNELRRIDILIPKEATILTSVPLAPWVHGWSGNAVRAPGILGDRHSAQEWFGFRTATIAQEKIRFLAEFPRPLYLFLNPKEQEDLALLESCLTKKSDFIFLYTCE